MSAVKLALLARQMRSQVEDVLRAEPIAIIGMGCRVPGANSLEAYWKLMLDGVDAIREVPPDRWDIKALYDPDFNTPGKISSRWGGFLDQVDGFDPTFFGITPREAQRMDPQQRLFLEVAYEALEDAGVTRERLNESQTGVFVASYHDDYTQMQYAHPDLIDGRTLTGTLQSIVSNRLSFLLNMHGPSITLDTACSSSLVAIHLACQHLRARECDLAVAGGVNVMLSGELNISMSKVGFLSPSGHCRTFDAGADGFVRGEGSGVIVLKRLSDAIADGDHIYAVIRGEAVNQDGRSNVLTAPNGMAHRQLIRTALENAGLKPSQISYIEAHGTGTALGDPIEVEALADVIGKGEQPCVLSSVKTNIGHLEAAAGVAGLIKAALSLQHEAIPGNAHYTALNPHISLEGTRFIISAEAQPWPRGETPRYVGISSFGVGGTNAHVILEEAPRLPAALKPEAGQAYLLPLSAHTPDALRARAADLRDLLRGDAHFTLNDLTYTASARRSHYDYRLGLVGTSAEELAEGLDSFVRGESRPGVFAGCAAGLEGKLAFVFSGQGPQWWAMGRELFEAEPVYRQTVEEIDRLLQPYIGWSLVEALNADEGTSRLDQTEVAQPALFALQTALAALWRSWGIAPDAVVGHSVGEIAAAYVAGALTLDDAVRVVYHRSRLMQRATGHGRMAAVELPADEAERAIASYASRVSVAAINSPTSVTLSGEPAAIDAVVAELSGRGVMTKMMRVNYAFHSPQMEAFQTELTTALKGIQTKKADIPVFSTVSSIQAVEGDFGAAYWARNIRQPVRFADAIRNMLADGCTTFLEISPHPVLAPSLEQSLNGNGIALTSLRRGRPERATLLTALGGLYTRGHTPDWKALYPNKGDYVRLPDYPWQRERYWLDVPQRKSRPALAAGQHPLLGKRLRSPSLADVVFEAELSAEWPPFVDDHRIYERAVLPATAYAEMALAAVAAVSGGSYTLRDLLIQEALTLQEARTVQTILHQEGDGYHFEMVSLGSGDAWTRHASGTVRRSDALPTAETLASIQARCVTPISSDEHYALMRALELPFGPRFQGVRALWHGAGEVLAQIELPQQAVSEVQPYQVYPALLDASLQPFSAATNLETGGGDLFLPLNVGSLQLELPLPAALWSHARLRELPTRQKPIVTGDVYLYDQAGQLVGAAQNVQFIRVDRGAMARSFGASADSLLYETRWQPASLTGDAVRDVKWLVVGGGSGISRQVADGLRSAGYKGVFEAVVDGSIQQTQAYIDLLKSAGADGRWRVVYLPALDAGLDDPQTAQRLVCGELLPLARAFAVPPELLLVTSGAQPVAGTAVTAPQQAPLWGMGSTLALEFPDWRVVQIDLDPTDSTLATLLGELTHESEENRAAYRGRERYAARLASIRAKPAEEPDDRPLHLELPASHVLDDLAYCPSARRSPGPGEVEICIQAAGLNFRDVLKTLGMYPGPAGPLGDEGAGEIVAVGRGVTQFKVGDRVMGVVPGAFDTYVTTRADLLVRLPDNLTYEDGAGIPIPFLTAYYALHHLALIQPGERVLVHAAAGGVGLAAVQLALMAGAEVIGTAGSPEKRAFLQSVGVQHVFSSRTLDFAGEIMQVTDGEGVDVVLNSLAGEFIPKSLSLLRDGGRFLEIGKTGIWDNEQVAAFKPNIAYHVIFLADQFDQEPELIHGMLVEVVDAIADGRLQPLPKQIFPAAKVIDAFRYMAQAKHIGKIIITHQEQKAIQPDGAYLITGGLSGIGLEAARWLAAQGARHLALMGRRAPSEGAQAVIDDLRRAGVQVNVLQGDVSQYADVERVIGEIGDALRGVFHAAGVNDDGVLLSLDWPRFETVMAAKVTGTWNLHAATQHLPLDHFVLFSSIAANFGSVGQANYAAANAFMDGFANWRQGQGLPALSVNWGPWENLGMTAVLSAADVERTRRQGMRGLMAEPAFGALGQLLTQDTAQATVLDMDWKAFARARQPIPSFFSELVQAEKPTQPKSAEKPGVLTIASQLREAPPNQRRRLLLNHIREQAALVMGLPASALSDPRQPLNSMGLDSLMAVELRNALGRSTNETLPATLIFDYPTLDALTEHLLNDVLKLGDAQMSEPEPVAQAAAPDELAELSDAEAEALLLEELTKPKKKGSRS
jgi:acyl transferase domain-containing protein/NADPH-dependent curcumin reductase CurA